MLPLPRKLRSCAGDRRAGRSAQARARHAGRTSALALLRALLPVALIPVALLPAALLPVSLPPASPLPVSLPPAVAPVSAEAAGPVASDPRPPPVEAAGTSGGASGFLRPLPGSAVSRPFQPPTTAYGPGHRGVDLAGAPGDVVLASGPGVVRFAGVVAGRPLVSVEHAGGLRTTYEPVRALVEPGGRVEAGTPLGLLEPGHPGCAAPACLHWGALRGGRYLDPLLLLGGGEVRLLPWSGEPRPAAELTPAVR